MRIEETLARQGPLSTEIQDLARRLAVDLWMSARDRAATQALLDRLVADRQRAVGLLGCPLARV